MLNFEKNTKWIIWSIDQFPELVEKYSENTWVIFPLNVENYEFDNIKEWFKEQNINRFHLKTMIRNDKKFIVIVKDYELLLLFKLTWA